MLKKLNIMLCFILFFVTYQPLFVSAAGEFQTIEVYDPQNLISTPLHYNPNYHGIDVILVYFSGTSIKKVRFSDYVDSSFSNPLNTKVKNASDYGWSYLSGFYFSCNRYYLAEFFGASDNLLVRIKIHVTGLVNPTCDSSSYGNYEDMGGSDSNSCNACELFSCPGWSDYMGKLTEIKNAIPPAPNWDQVAATFRDTIVPRLVTDMQTMLGTAPSPPAEPADLSGVDTGGIENQVPSMPDAGLDTSGFTKSRIESEAPEIPFRNDESGGFDIVNPIDTLPSLPDKMPEPGNTDAGGWDAGHPQQPDDQPMPIPKDQSGTPDTGNAPIPSQNNDTPPSPGDNGGNAPIPNQDDGIQESKYYKKHPDDPDGSGGG